MEAGSLGVSGEGQQAPVRPDALAAMGGPTDELLRVVLTVDTDVDADWSGLAAVEGPGVLTLAAWQLQARPPVALIAARKARRQEDGRPRPVLNALRLLGLSWSVDSAEIGFIAKINTACATSDAVRS